MLMLPISIPKRYRDRDRALLEIEGSHTSENGALLELYTRKTDSGLVRE